MIGRYVLLEYKLTGEYAEVFKKVRFYTTIHELDETVCDEMMMDLLDMLLSAQEEQRPVGSIVGEDIEVFCRNYFGEYESKGYMKRWLTGIYWLCWLAAILEFFFLEEGTTITMQSETDILPYMVGFFGADLLCKLISVIFRRFFFQKSSEGAYFISLLLVLVLFVLAQGFLPETLCLNIPLWLFYAVIAAYIVIYKAVQLGGRYRRTGSLFRKRSEYQTTFGNAVKEEMKLEEQQAGGAELMLAKGFLKQYERMNQKRQKRGKAPLSEEQFHQKIAKNNRVSGWSVSIGLMAGVGIGWWWTLFSMTGFSVQMGDVLVFLFMECGCLLLAKFVFLNKAKDPVARLLKLCEVQEKNLIDYARGDREADGYDL